MCLLRPEGDQVCGCPVAGGEKMSTPDDPDAFSKLLKRLKESQDVHAASANSAKQAESLVDAKRR